MTTNQLYKIPEIAQKLSLSKSKVYGLIADGKIKTLKIDKSIRVSEEALTKFINSIGAEDGLEN
jgi:excisionase family DNA binding protein